MVVVMMSWGTIIDCLMMTMVFCLDMEAHCRQQAPERPTALQRPPKDATKEEPTDLDGVVTADGARGGGGGVGGANQHAAGGDDTLALPHLRAITAVTASILALHKLCCVGYYRVNTGAWVGSGVVHPWLRCLHVL